MALAPGRVQLEAKPEVTKVRSAIALNVNRQRDSTTEYYMLPENTI